MPDNIIIEEQKVAPGENAVLKIKVARLHTGNKINLNVHVYRSLVPGPTLLLLGGVHGDEINGVEIVRRCIAEKLLEDLNCGSVIAIPLLNIYGFLNFSRDLPDGKDVNRSFPGRKNGSLASRVAYALTKKVLPWVDFGLDFHTGGGFRYNYPQIRHSPTDEAAKKLAEIFGAPYIVPSKPIDKSLRKEAKNMGIPMLVYEGGESLRLDAYSIQEGLNGVLRILNANNMVDSAPAPHKSVTIAKKSWLRSSRSGMFRWLRQAGDSVTEGEILGVINDTDGQDEVLVTSPRDGIIFCHNNAPVVNQGDALFHIGAKH